VGKEQNLSPLGEIRKGVKILKYMTLFITKIIHFNPACRAGVSEENQSGYNT